MPYQPLTVQISQPCAASWEAMTSTAAGRHCAACQHEVVDFTAFTDGELAAYLARPGKLPCGRFRSSQLDRPLWPAARPVAGWRRWWGAVAALLGLGALAAPAQAQQAPARPASTPAGQTNPEAAPLLGRMVHPSQQRPRKPVEPVQVKPAAVEQSMLMGKLVPAPAPKKQPKP